LLVLGVAVQGGLHGGQFIGRDIPGEVFATLPTLEFVVGAAMAGTLFEGVGREFAPLHSGNGGDLLKELLFGGSIHIGD
jgi:hypothetical protein